MRGQLLVLGDLHLGRRPQQIPPGMDPKTLGPEEGWRRAVELALKERVSALLLAGDVVEGLHDRFEAERILRPGIERLREAQIPVIAVLGNHDVYALPRLEKLVGGFEILGREGWESRLILGPDGPLCQLLGWSFQDVAERRNPLSNFVGVDRDHALPTIGLLHCDLDVQESPYAPVSSREFEVGLAAQVDAFLLGHIHKPNYEGLARPRPFGYLGSVVGLSPKERGPHGPWLIQIEGPGQVRAQQRALAPIRYESLKLELPDSELASLNDIEDDLLRRARTAMSDLVSSLGSEAYALRACVIRFQLEGRVSRPDLVGRAFKALIEAEALVLEQGSITISCNSFQSSLLPAVDLRDLERSPGAVGGLVKRWLRREDLDQLKLQALESELQDLLQKNCWKDLEVLEDLNLEECLREAGRELLSSLLQAADAEP